MGASPASSVPGSQAQDHKSAFVLGLAESQGTLAVVSALLAGFSYSGFCSVTREELERAHYIVQYAFSLSNALSASMALFVTIVCSLCEQQGRVARSFAVLRSHEPEFEDTVHEWWKSFAQIRTNAVFVFIYSIPVFFISMACISLIKLPTGPCVVAVGILMTAGLAIFHQLLLVNDLFRARILRFFTGSAGFAPPSLDPEPTPEAIPAAKLNRSLSKAMLGTVKSWPSRQNSFPEGLLAPERQRSHTFSSEGSFCDESQSSDFNRGGTGQATRAGAGASAAEVGAETTAESEEGCTGSAFGASQRLPTGDGEISPPPPRLLRRLSGRSLRTKKSEGACGGPGDTGGDMPRGKSVPSLRLSLIREATQREDSPGGASPLRSLWQGLRRRRRVAWTLAPGQWELDQLAVMHARSM